MKRALGILIVVIIVEMFLLFLAGSRISIIQNENNRLSQNQAALCDSLAQIRTSDGLRAYQVRQLTLTLKELRTLNTSLYGEIHRLRVRPRDVKEVERIVTRNVVSFVPDTIYMSPSKETRELRYCDDWINFRLDSVGVAQVAVRDSLTIIRHARTHRFLWWTWKRYSDRLTVASKCPYVNVESVEVVGIE